MLICANPCINITKWGQATVTKRCKHVRFTFVIAADAALKCRQWDYRASGSTSSGRHDFDRTSRRKDGEPSLFVKSQTKQTMMTNTVHPEFALKASVERSRRRFLPPLLNASLLIREGQYFSWESWPENKVDEVTFFFFVVCLKPQRRRTTGEPFTPHLI